METTHWWLINILAIQVISVIGMGYRICFLAKRHLVMVKVKTPANTLTRVNVK